MHYCQREGHHINITHRSSQYQPISSQDQSHLANKRPVSSSHLWASYALHTLLFIMKMKLVHGSKQKFIPPWYLEYHPGVEEQARIILTRRKNSGRSFSPLKWTWTLWVWQLARGDAWCTSEHWIWICIHHFSPLRMGVSELHNLKMHLFR